jgi:putative ABC transport system substrate-binding protein
VAVIAAPGSLEQALAAKAATQTIPIVFVIGPAPVESGLVASLARPGANITGTTALSTETISKCLEVLHELLPAAAVIALLVDPTNPLFTEIETREAQLQAQALGLRLLVLNAAHQDEFAGAFNSLVQQGAGALLVSSGTLFTAQRERIVTLATRHAVPAIFHYREVVETGGSARLSGRRASTPAAC